MSFYDEEQIECIVESDDTDEYIDTLIERLDEEIISKEEFDVLTEGVENNRVILRMISKRVSQYKKSVKKIKYYNKKKEFEKARREIRIACNTIDEIYKELDKIPDTFDDALLSRVPQLLKGLSNTEIIEMMREIDLLDGENKTYHTSPNVSYRLSKELDDMSRKLSKGESFNRYRYKLEHELKDEKKLLRELETKINKHERRVKKTEKMVRKMKRIHSKIFSRK